MPKIQNVGIGKFIRDLRKTGHSKGQRISSVLQIATNEGNAFKCFPVKSVHSGRIVLDTTKYHFIPIDSEVEEVSIT